MKNLIAVGLFLMAFGGFAFANEWIQNDTINASLSAYDSFSAPSIFQMAGTWYMISGQNNGNITGFDWTGAQWEQNASINATDIIFNGGRQRIVIQYYAKPTVFQMNGIWEMIIGSWDNSYYGFSWNGTMWIENTSLIAGLLNPSNSNAYASPTGFQLNDNNTYLIAGVINGSFPANDWIFDGYVWNGTDWLENSTVVYGLPAGIMRASPNVFIKNGTIYLIYGNIGGGFAGFTWNGSGWSGSNIADGLADVGGFASPMAFELDSKNYLISGELNGGYFGFNWNDTVLTPLPPILYISNPTNTTYTPLAPVPDYQYVATSMVNSTISCETFLNGTSILNDTVTNNSDSALIPLNITEAGFYELNLSCTDDYGSNSQAVYFTIPLEYCHTITSDTAYTMQGDVSITNNPCYALNGNNILFDCNGHSINYDSGEGIEIGAVDSSSNITIQNCIFNAIDDFNILIYGLVGNDITIQNNIFNGANEGIGIYNTATDGFGNAIYLNNLRVTNNSFLGTTNKDIRASQISNPIFASNIFNTTSTATTFSIYEGLNLNMSDEYYATEIGYTLGDLWNTTIVNLGINDSSGVLDITTIWYVIVNVTDENGTGIDGALVTVNNSLGNLVYSESTSGGGFTSQFSLIEKQITTLSGLYYNPYLFVAEISEGVFINITTNVTQSRYVNLQASPAPSPSPSATVYPQGMHGCSNATSGYTGCYLASEIGVIGTDVVGRVLALFASLAVLLGIWLIIKWSGGETSYG